MVEWFIQMVTIIGAAVYIDRRICSIERSVEDLVKRLSWTQSSDRRRHIQIVDKDASE